MECLNVYIILPQVVAHGFFYANEYSLTANEHYEGIPTYSTEFQHIADRLVVIYYCSSLYRYF